MSDIAFLHHPQSSPGGKEPSAPVDAEQEQSLARLAERHRSWYVGAEIDSKLKTVIRDAPESKLSDWDIHRLLRLAQAVYFDAHVEVVSGHHTATYLRFESIAQVPQLVTLIARDMADWLRQTYHSEPIQGLVVTASAAHLLAERVVDLLRDTMPMRLVVTPYEHNSGRIGTQIIAGLIRSGERFVALNDVTTRGNCVSKLGKVVTDAGGLLAGMMVFARRDSGQFPLMGSLTARYPFYYTTDLTMPQWEPADCPMCRTGEPLLSWRNIPEL
jgi:orotate phosphoribosyltransferase